MILLFVSVILTAAAYGEEIGLTVYPDPVRPGKTERYVISLPADGAYTCELTKEGDTQVLRMLASGQGTAGDNAFIWDGLLPDGTSPAAGTYTVTVRQGVLSSQTSLAVGTPAPRVTDITIMPVSGDGILQVSLRCSVNGTLVLTADQGSGEIRFFEKAVAMGENTVTWDGMNEGKHISGGDWVLRAWLNDETGFSSTKQNRSFTYPTIEDAQEENVPSADTHIVVPSRVTGPEDEFNYWTLPLGVLDEEKIWQVMMQPMTVIDGNQKEVYRLRATPDNSSAKSNIVGEITYASQGVHVLETLDNGWTLVEAYNSSYGPNCASRRGYGVTNELIRGYVKTSLLKTVQPQDYMGLLIDKKNQTMYIFENGHITGTLLVSTGLNNKTQSWNETPSGEYIMISKIGGFAAGNLWCSYGMRVNGGCAIHEVPYIGNQNTPAAKRDYSSSVKLLGQRASHGCIRVQKAANEAGQNIKWLWDHMKVGVKVLIWEDAGRFTEYPDQDQKLYYNPNGGKLYHDDQYCKGVKSRWLPLKAFSWGELEEEPYASLTLCPTCGKTLRRTEIDQINRDNGF